jgi:putative flavoprotein involved in K+ transport
MDRADRHLEFLDEILALQAAVREMDHLRARLPASAWTLCPENLDLDSLLVTRPKWGPCVSLARSPVDLSEWIRSGDPTSYRSAPGPTEILVWVSSPEAEAEVDVLAFGARLLFEQFTGDRTVAEICSALATSFDFDEEEVLRLVKAWLERGVLLDPALSRPEEDATATTGSLPTASTFGLLTAAGGEAGCRLKHLDPEGSLAEAGASVGDLVTRVAGRSVRSELELRQALAAGAAGGAAVEVELCRIDQPFVLQVQPRERRPLFPSLPVRFASGIVIGRASERRGGAELVENVVIGAGHAGLCVSRALRDANREHLVLERGRVAERWSSERWSSFTLLAPNWHASLLGQDYDKGDVDGFMTRSQIVEYIQDYARSFGAPVRCGAPVTRLARAERTDRLRLHLGGQREGQLIEAATVVVATGGFQAPSVPRIAASLPPDILQLHSSRYRSPDQLPPGGVLVVGTGASGQQIADELYRAGRAVFLSVGRHKKAPRRYRGRDIVWWLEQLGVYDETVDSAEARRRVMSEPTNALSGANGGTVLDLHRFAADGVVLLGRLRGVSGAALRLGSDLRENLSAADRALAKLKTRIDQLIRQRGIAAPAAEDDPFLSLSPSAIRDRSTLDLRKERISTVLWATGYRNDLGWIDLPILDDHGEVIHRRGLTRERGLGFAGLRWQHKRRSHFIVGAAEDAAYVAAHLVDPGREAVAAFA